MRKIIILDPAFDDLDAISAYIGEANPKASVRFLEAAEQAFTQIAEMPGIGKTRRVLNPRLAGMRQWPIKGFAVYVVFYLAGAEDVRIVRVLHGARDIDNILSEEQAEETSAEED